MFLLLRYVLVMTQAATSIPRPAMKRQAPSLHITYILSSGTYGTLSEWLLSCKTWIPTLSSGNRGRRGQDSQRHDRKPTLSREPSVRHKPVRSGSTDNGRLCGCSTARTRQLSRDVPTDEGFLWDKATMLRDSIKGTTSRIKLDALLTRQDRHCTYNIILWRVRVTVIAVEKQ